MNSAPVQLLPIESGSGYMQKPHDKEFPVDNNGKFDDVFSRTVSESESMQAEEKTIDNPSDKSSPKKETETSGAGLGSGKKKEEPEVSVREDVSAEKAANSKIQHNTDFL